MPPDYVTRFAPSPTGSLHLGHAYSAMLAWDRAQAAGGTFLLRIEDTDAARCRPEYEAAIYDDLHWLGLTWAEPVLRQSDHMERYASALNQLMEMGLCYPCHCSRGDIRAALSAPQEGVLPTRTDGPIYPGTCRHREIHLRGPMDAIRLNMTRAVALLGDVRKVRFREIGPAKHGAHSLDAAHLITDVGDIVLARRDIGTASYHLAVVVDDADQGVTEVVRGVDLFDATRIHRLLQALLQLPTPTYYHHDLIRDDRGKRLAKRDDAQALSKFRAEGVTPADIRRMVGS